MINKNKNIQRSIVLPKELNDKISAIAKENCTSFNSVVKKILSDYVKEKGNDRV